MLSWSWQCMDAYFQKYRYYKNNFSFVICVTFKLLSNFCFLCLITVCKGESICPCMNMWLIVNLYVPHYQFYDLFYNNSLLSHTFFHSSVAPKTLSNIISLLVHFDNCLELTMMSMKNLMS